VDDSKQQATRLLMGDCIEVMATLEADSIDSIVTDPPYGLEFMGKEWDRFGATVETADEGTDKSHPFRDGTERARFHRGRDGSLSFGAWSKAWAAAAIRVLKPGGHLLAFGGTRTYHRLTCALEDAGFEIRDCLMYLYGSGFPKSMDISKAIDKAAGKAEERGYVEATGGLHGGSGNTVGCFTGRQLSDNPVTAAATAWQGWGTALKPAYEPIVLARKPISEQNIAENVLKHGTGAINVDGCRIAGSKIPAPTARGESRPWLTTADVENLGGNDNLGRWPANLMLDEESAKILDEQSGRTETPDSVSRDRSHTGNAYSIGSSDEVERGIPCFGDSGGASRFFYTAKADRRERDAGLAGMPNVRRTDGRETEHNVPNLRTNHRQNHHPTVKPIDLMTWLVRLVTPPSGTILDPFLGSGSTGIAAKRLGLNFIGIERENDYIEIARLRIEEDAPLFQRDTAPIEDRSTQLELIKTALKISDALRAQKSPGSGTEQPKHEPFAVNELD
jgi:DNA modification methylase